MFILTGLHRTIEPLLVDPPTLEANLSNQSDPRVTYSVVLTAVVGANKSTPVFVTYSYFMSTPAPYKCESGSSVTF